MGMFDDINYPAPCPICGTPLTGWQLKDAGCQLDYLTPAELWEQRYDHDTATVPEQVNFYTDCGKCGTWVDITIGSAYVDMTKHDYECLRQGIPLNRRRGPILPAGGDGDA